MLLLQIGDEGFQVSAWGRESPDFSRDYLMLASWLAGESLSPKRGTSPHDVPSVMMSLGSDIIAS